MSEEMKSSNSKCVPFAVKGLRDDSFSIPCLGLGTYGKSDSDTLKKAILHALEVGYRHIDTAYVYKNEDVLGEVLNEGNLKSLDLGISRKDLFVTSKLWNTDHNNVLAACKKTLNNLNTSYLDLYLVHWPIGFKKLENEDGKEILFPHTDEKYVNNDSYLDPTYSLKNVWQEMEKLVVEGLVRHIGVSNFNIKELKELLSFCKIRPVINQIECHPFLIQKELNAFCKEEGILITAYSPLANSGIKRQDIKGAPKPEKMDCFKNLCEKYGKTTPQIFLRWNIQCGRVVIPKSTNFERIETNFQVFDFELSDEEMSKIEATCSKYPKRFVNPNWRENKGSHFTNEPISNQ